MICPRCKGCGQMDLGVHEGGSVTTVKIRCITCDGDGEIDHHRYQMYRQEVEMWCRCGNPSGEVDYFEDGQDEAIGMHHYKCRDCGKVIQTG